jgi:hypothetical protein
MAKKKNISKNDIIGFYMNYVLEHNQNPKSVFMFSKNNNFEEAKFYEHFTSFETIEKSIFETFCTNTINLLNESNDFKTFDARNKLLSFYFTFFETLTANRSYVKFVLYRYKHNLKGLKTLSSLKHAFLDFVKVLEIEMIDLKQDKLEKIQQKTLQESAWLQLLIIIKFWMDDESPSFEKTDIFIEKSVNTSFDVLDIAPLKSVIDLGKFLFKEKFQMN